MEEIYINNEIKSKDQILLESLIIFFNDEKKLNILVAIVFNKTKISIRMIEWFVTIYCKQYNVCYFCENGVIYDDISLLNVKFNNIIDVHSDYKAQLKSYKKKLFDPFSRKTRVSIPYGDKKLITTIGQLNFFKWAINKGIISYLIKNYDSIHSIMKTNVDKSKKSKKMRLPNGNLQKQKKII